MSIGDLTARFEDEAVAAETLMALGDVALLADISAAAAQRSLTLGEFASVAVEQFARGATNEDWLMLIGRLARAEDPGAVFLHEILSAALGASGRAPRQTIAPHALSAEH